MSVANLFTDPTSQIIKTSAANWNTFAAGGLVEPQKEVTTLKVYFGGVDVATVPVEFYRIGYICSIVLHIDDATGEFLFPGSGSPPQLMVTEPIPGEYAGNSTSISTQIGTVMLVGQSTPGSGQPQHYVSCPIALVHDVSPVQTLISINSPDWGVLSTPGSPTTYALGSGDFKPNWTYTFQPSSQVPTNIQFTYSLTDIANGP